MELNPASTEEYFCGPAGHAFRPPPSVLHSIFFLGKKCAICDTLLISGSSLALRGDETSMINECYFCDTYVHYGCRSRCTTPCPRTVYKGAKGTSLAEAADRDSSSLAVPPLSPPPPPVSSPSSPPETKSAPVDVFGSLKEYSNALSLAMKKSAITFRRPKEDEEEMVTFHYDPLDDDEDDDDDIDLFSASARPESTKPEGISVMNMTSDIEKIISAGPKSAEPSDPNVMTSLPLSELQPSETQSKRRSSSLSVAADIAKSTVNATRRTSTAVGTTAALPYRLTKSYILGTVIGASAGLLISGPAGIILGSKIGQTVGTSGVLVGSVVTIGGAVGGGALAANSNKVGELMGEGRSRTVKFLNLSGGKKKMEGRDFLLMRTQESVPENFGKIVEEINKERPREGWASSLFRRSDSEQDSRSGDLDILQMTAEECGGLGEKVMLLVSRVLKDSKSDAGFLYQALVAEFKRRHSGGGGGEPRWPPDETNTPIADAHGVIHHVTLSFLEQKDEVVGRGKEMATKVAIAVDALVFGQVYEEVFADAKRLCAADDKILNGKVTSFFENLSRERYEDILRDVSEPAVEALRYVSTKCHTAPDKLAMCVKALEYIDGNRGLNGDELLTRFIQHVIVMMRGPGEVVCIDEALHADLRMIEEFCQDDILCLGKEGYAMAIFQSGLMFLKSIPGESYGVEIWDFG